MVQRLQRFGSYNRFKQVQSPVCSLAAAVLSLGLGLHI
jgi:hypothetical protein